MNVNFPQPKESIVSLGEVAPGSIIRFMDSSKGAQTLIQAQLESGENLFLAFFGGMGDDAKLAQKHTNLMSLDGEHICSRQNDRLVVVHEVAGYRHNGATTKALESIPVGAVIIHGITEKAFVGKGHEEQYEFLYARTKETPAVTGRAPFISLAGKKIFLDDDRMVLAVNDFVLNFK